MRRAILLSGLLMLLLAPLARAGVEMGGHPGIRALKPLRQLAVQLTGKVMAIRWVPRTGRAVTTTHVGPASAAMRLTPPPGEWVELIFDGPIQLRDALGHVVVVELDGLTLPFEHPIEGGGTVDVALDLVAPDGLWSAGPHLAGDHPLVLALADAALARQESTDE